jgi:mxaA protein
MTVRIVATLLLMSVLAGATEAQPAAETAPTITITAPRDIGFFAGDLITADVTIAALEGATVDHASLPMPGPLAYWLDLRAIAVEEHGHGRERRIVLRLEYQNFYVALDARRMEIPGFTVRLTAGSAVETVEAPPWTIGVSPLREVAPPAQEDPKTYLQPDRAAPRLDTGRWWDAAGALAIATLLALVLLAFDRAWWPFHRRPARHFAAAVRRLRGLRGRSDTEEAYLEALLILHRALDRADGRRILADDVPAFLDRHIVFAPLRPRLETFFQASRRAFFGSAPDKARRDLSFEDLQVLGRDMAVAERSRP